MPKKSKRARSIAVPDSANDFVVVILAAGKGTRLKSRRPKVLHEIGGKPLLEHVIDAAGTIVPPERMIAIIGHEAAGVRTAVEHTGIKFIVQAEQRGTGHAVMCAREVLKDFAHVLVLSGDVPLIRPETISSIQQFHLSQRASMTILTAVPPDPSGYGRVFRKSRNSPEVTAIVEQKALKRSQLKAPEINSGIYAFRTADLFSHIDRLNTKNAHGEYYLTDMASILVKAKKRVVALSAGNIMEVLGANTLRELVVLDAAMRMNKALELLASGVTIFRPETCVIDSTVQIGPDTVIEPFVQLLGKTHIGSDCRIRSYSVISDSEIADGVLVRPGCIIDNAKVASRALLGPYSHLRPGTEIGEGAHIGNFVETKKVRMGRGSKANHLSYLGDAEIGAGVNIGAGTITCNYDGINKHPTVIEDGVFVGSDSTLVAPVRLGSGSYVAAASCITHDVPVDALALGRSPQTIKEGWAKRKREERAAAKAK